MATYQNFNSLIQLATDKTASVVGTLGALRDYYSNFKNKVAQWMEDSGITSSLSVEVVRNGISYVCQLTKAQFNQALEDGTQELKLMYGSYGSELKVKGDVILNSIEEKISACNLNGEFIDYCLNSVQVKATEFISAIKAKFPSVTGSMLEQVQGLLTTGDPVTALKGFVQTAKSYLCKQDTDPNTGEQFLTVVTATDYSGASPFSIIWDRVASGFQTLVDGFKAAWDHMDTFFETLGQYMLKWGSWLVKKLFGPLTTRFETGNASYGILDFPIMQIKIGHYNSTTHRWYNNGHLAQMASNWNNASERYMLNISDVYKRDSRPCYEGFLDLETRIVSNVGLVDEAGIPVPSTMEYVVPSGDMFDFVIRFGCDNSYNVWMQVYPFCANNILDYFEHDGKVVLKIRNCLRLALINISTDVPLLSSPDPDDDLNCINITNNIFSGSWSSTDDNVDLVSALPWSDGDKVYDSTNPSHVLAGGLVYALLAFLGKHSQFSSYYMELANRNDSSIGCNVGRQVTSLNMLDFDGYAAEFDFGAMEGFKPYLQYSSYGTAVHYQTLNDWATEISKYIITLLVAAAAIFVAVKFKQWKRRVQARADAARGTYDSLTWEVGSKPSAQQMKDLLKAEKRARKCERLNNLINGASESASNAGSALASSGVSSVLSMFGINPEADDPTESGCTTTEIKTLISGV